MKEYKTALVTGGTRGIGRAISLELAKNGFNIGINFLKNFELAENLKKEIEEKYNVKVVLLQGDVSVENDTKRIANEFISYFNQIDLLVNNAGITKDNLIIRMSSDDFKKVLETNLFGPFLITKEVLPYMIKRKYGVIINISSIVAIFGNKGQCNYSSSKGGLISFTKSLAKEVASRNIRVNAIAPGFIETDMTDCLDFETKEKILNFIPLKRFGKPEEVAKLVTSLASDESSYITGQVFLIDGGLSLGFQI
jgi:3-oxoacyl-[acyl-carrier protein] reductase